MEALAAALPRKAVTWDERRGPRDHYAEMWLTFQRDDAGEWAWEMEYLALDSKRNFTARNADLAEVLRLTGEHITSADAGSQTDSP